MVAGQDLRDVASGQVADDLDAMIVAIEDLTEAVAQMRTLSDLESIGERFDDAELDAIGDRIDEHTLDTCGFVIGSSN